MRRIVSIATLSICLFLASIATAAAASQASPFGSVNAAADSSGVSITINQSSVSVNGDTSGTMSITVSSASTDETLVCTLEPGSADIDVHGQGNIDVTWLDEHGISIVLGAPSIRLAGVLSNFSCESVD